MRWVVVRAVRFMTPLWQILTLKRSPGTRTGLFAFNSRIVRNPYLGIISGLPVIRTQCMPNALSSMEMIAKRPSAAAALTETDSLTSNVKVTKMVSRS
jgi:hypothetical protein